MAAKNVRVSDESSELYCSIIFDEALLNDFEKKVFGENRALP